MELSVYSVDKEQKVAVDESQELAIEIVDATEKYTREDFDRVLRKQDMILMPLMWIANGIQQVDRSGLSTQSIFGIIADTHMKGNDYAWLSTIFYIFYLLGEFPGNWIMQKFSVGKTLALAMFCWGTIVFCTAAAQNWRDLMVMRALQGVAESFAGPALLLITGMSYRTGEHSLRVMIWCTAGYALSMIVNLINYGIGRAAQAEPGGLAAWKGMSLFLGATSVLVSILCFFFLGTPREVFWLSPEEKKIQAARVALNNTGSDAQKRAEWKWSQVSEAFRDPQLYFFFFVTVSYAIPSGGIITFGYLIYVGLGFTPLDTLVKGALPPQILGASWFILSGYLLSKLKHMRFYWMMLSIIPAFVGVLVLSLLPNTHKNLWPKWGAFFITATAQVCGSLVWSILSTNVAGRTKKSVMSVVLFIANCFGNAVGAQVFQAKWAPQYRPSMIILSIMFAIEFILMALWRLYYVTINHRRAARLDAGRMFSRSNYHDQITAAAPLTNPPPQLPGDYLLHPDPLIAHYSRLESLLDSALAMLTLIRDHAPAASAPALNGHMAEVLQALCRHAPLPTPTPIPGTTTPTMAPATTQASMPPKSAMYAEATTCTATDHVAVEAPQPEAVPIADDTKTTPRHSERQRDQRHVPDLIFRFDKPPYTVPLEARTHPARIFVDLLGTSVIGDLRLAGIHWTPKGNLTFTFTHDKKFTAEKALKLAPAIWQFLRPRLRFPKHLACPRVDPGGSWHNLVIHNVPLKDNTVSNESVHTWLRYSGIADVQHISVMCSDTDIDREKLMGRVHVPLQVALSSKADADLLVQNGAVVFGSRCRVSRYVPKTHNRS